MLGSFQSYFYSIPFCCKYVKSVFLLLILACGCSVSSAHNYTTPEEQLHQQGAEQPLKKSWANSQADGEASLAGRCFSGSNLLGGAEYGKSHDNSISCLQHVLDDNDLSVTLEAFKKKNVFEVLAMVYVSILLEVGELEQDIINAGLESPSWIIGFSGITQEIKKRACCRLPKSTKTTFTQLTKEEQMFVAEVLNSRAKQCFYKLHTLWQDKVKTSNASPLICAKLDEQVSSLMLRAQNDTHFLNEVVLKQTRNLVDVLSTHYVVATTSNTPSEIQYPVLEALVNWGARNSDSLISKLLDDSKRWVTQDYHLTAEENKTNGISAEEKVFFSYLHYNSKDVTEVWHGANESLRDCEAREIANTLLASDVIKNLSDQFKTVQQLNVIYQSGFVALDAMHSNLEQQESLNPEDQAKTKKDKQNESFGQEDWDEYLEEGLKKNMKDSLLGKVASGINYVFNVVKNGFTAPPTKQEQSKKIMTAWVNMVQKNALHLTDNSDNTGIQLVMAELIKIDSLHKEGDITIKDALTILVAQGFTSSDKEQAFTLLTGLQRKADIRQKTYCYQPLVTAVSDKNANDCELQYEQADQPIDIPASGNDFAKHNSAEEKHRDWLSMPTNDYTLQKSKSQNDVADNEADGSYESDGTNTTKSSPLHVDWCFINLDCEEKNEEQARGQCKTVWIGSSYNSSFYNRLLMGAVIGLCVLAVVDSAPAANSPQAETFFQNHTQAHDSSNLNSNHFRHIRDVSAASASNVIGISNVTELNLIGNHADYPSNGHYKLTASFNVKNFTGPIDVFTGDFNGNNETLDELPCCLIDKLSGNGIVQNINLNNVDTRNAECDPAVANTMHDKSIVRFIKIANSKFEGVGINSRIGMVSNIMWKASSFDNVMIANSTLNGLSGVERVGGVVGEVHHIGLGSECFKVMIVNVNITSLGSHLGGIVGKVRSLRIKEVYIGNTIVKGADQDTFVGGVAGYSVGSTMQNVTVIDSIISGDNVGGVVGFSWLDNVRICHVIRAKVNGETVGGVIGFCAVGEMKNATVASSTIIAHTDAPSAGGGIGYARRITSVDLTVIDTVIDTVIGVVNASSLDGSPAVGGGFGRSDLGVKFLNTMIIKTNLSIDGVSVHAGWGGGQMAENDAHEQLAVSQSFINIMGVKDIKIGGAVGVIDSASISNFTVSRSMVLFEGEESNVQIGFCMGYNKDGNSTCDFDETKKIFDHSSYNDTNETSYDQYSYNMNLANQCRRSKLPFIGEDCEIKPEEYCRYKEPLIIVWNAPCLTQAQTPDSAATVPTTALSAPTEAPTGTPTEAPTGAPTEAPTGTPTEAPTGAPTEAPTGTPTEAPTGAPTEAPTGTPTEAPTGAPTEAPTGTPTEAPTGAPTEAPTGTPTEAPTGTPTEAPTETPTEAPTGTPTETPTETPKEAPTRSTYRNTYRNTYNT
ncbi:MAG: hypothetical protein QS721_06315, partial [Candidatus Endonucleobacter sp. (ex Gigantidas childressi)]|nr:hypothetical protein [Candidatus Endonucleobacter sp. (ex Gigantidas childressi)]